MVIDIDAEQIAKLRRDTTIATATSTSLSNMWLVKLILAIGALAVLLPAFLLLSSGNAAGVLTALMAFGSVTVAVSIVSVGLEAMNEIYRCRRLLEELVRKRG